MDTIEIPEYFICPISLQIMKDPVTTVSGITYDRESIEHWLFKNHNTICPVTNQPLPRDSDLTPNHTLRRLIQAWCTLNASNGVERIPTPKSPLSKLYVLDLIQDLRRTPDARQLKTLQKLESLALENDRNKVYMVEAGLGNALITFIISCYKNGKTNGLDEALSLFYLVRRSLTNSRGTLTENDEILESLIWVLDVSSQYGNMVLKSHAAYAVRAVVQKANASMLERLKPELFRRIISHLRYDRKDVCVSQQATNSLLHMLLDACPWGRNRMMMVEAGAVFDLIELELRTPEKKTTELVLGIVYHLCSCAEGRAQLLNHAAGIAVVTRRMLSVSAAAGERALLILWQIGRYSGTNGVLQEMLRVGTVTKLCMVMQADCASHLKEKAREILRTHFDVWRDSPCIELATLTRHTR